MSALWLLAITALGIGLVLAPWEDDEEAPQDADQDETQGEQGLDITVSDGADVLGSGNADTITWAEGETQSAGTVDAQGGDDIVDLFDVAAYDPDDPGSYPTLGDVEEVLGGDGNDTIHAPAEGALIDGGKGDDQITYFGGQSDVRGGEGNDTITAHSPGYDAATLSGGDGDDVLNAENFDSGTIDGGAGDDTIFVRNQTWIGTGYTLNVTGGEGDDTITFDASQDMVQPIKSAVVQGGAGADVFGLTIEETPGADTPPQDADIRREVMTVTDFEVGTDRLHLDLEETHGDFSLASVSMEAQSGQTSIVVRYETQAALKREIVIQVESTGLSWDDVDLDGVDRSFLAPII